MSIVKDFGSNIIVYDYSDRSLLLTSPMEWGKANSSLLKTIAKYGNRFKLGEKENVSGWIMSKRQQEEIFEKIQPLVPQSSQEKPVSPNRNLTLTIQQLKEICQGTELTIREKDGVYRMYGPIDKVDETMEQSSGIPIILFEAHWDEIKLVEFTLDSQ